MPPCIEPSAGTVTVAGESTRAGGPLAAAGRIPSGLAIAAAVPITTTPAARTTRRRSHARRFVVVERDSMNAPFSIVAAYPGPPARGGPAAWRRPARGSHGQRSLSAPSMARPSRVRQRHSERVACWLRIGATYASHRSPDALVPAHSGAGTSDSEKTGLDAC